MKLKNIAKLILGLYVVAVFSPNLTSVLDLNTFRLLSFSIVNAISLLFLISYNELSDALSKVVKSKISIVSVAFILWALASYFYALNSTEVIVRSFTFINFYLLYLNLSVLLGYVNLKKINITFLISLLLLGQITVSYYSYFQIIEFKAYDFELNNLLLGIFSNRNVTSAVYLLQVPFVIYTIINSSSKFIRNFCVLILLATLFLIFLLASRTAYLILLALLLFYLFHLIKNRINILKFNKSAFGILIISLLITYTTSVYTLGQDNSSNAISRIQTIDFNEESTNNRLRYYGYAFEQVKSNPLIGVGYGNWKIVSVEKDKKNIISYIVPYTMHNDFLEILVELGLFGLLMYSFIILFPLYNHRFEIFDNKGNEFGLILASSLVIFIIDSNINFPALRMSTLFYLALILSLFYINKFKLNESN